MSLWHKVKKQGAEGQKLAAEKLDDVKTKAAEHAIVYQDTWRRSVGALPTGYKAGLYAGLGLTAVALGGVAYFAGRLAKEEPETAGALKKATDLFSAFLAKTLAQ